VQSTLAKYCQQGNVLHCVIHRYIKSFAGAAGYSMGECHRVSVAGPSSTVLVNLSLKETLALTFQLLKRFQDWVDVVKVQLAG
jgi:hypothetical protein